MNPLRKIVKDGRVAVLVSPRFGSGWYSWNTKYPQCLFEPEIVERVLAGEPYTKPEIEALTKSLYGDDFYAGGAKNLRVEWLAEGTLFKINEYDGNETLETCVASVEWIVA